MNTFRVILANGSFEFVKAYSIHPQPKEGVVMLMDEGGHVVACFAVAQIRGIIRKSAEEK